MNILNVAEAEIRLIDGRIVPLVRIDGRWHVIDTKPSLIALGVAVAIPVDDSGRDDWDTVPRFEATIPADAAAGRPVPMRMQDVTDDPTVLALASRFNELVVAGEARPGPLSLPVGSLGSLR